MATDLNELPIEKIQVESRLQFILRRFGGGLRATSGVLVAFLVVVFLFYITVHFFLSDRIDIDIQTFVREQMSGLQYDQMSVSTFPSLQVHFTNVSVTMEDREDAGVIKMGQLDGKIGWLDYFQKKMRPSKWTLSNVKIQVNKFRPFISLVQWRGETNYSETWKAVLLGLRQANTVVVKNLSLGYTDGIFLGENLNFILKGVRNLGPIELKGKGKLASSSLNFYFSGKFWLDIVDFTHSRLDMSIDLRDADASRLAAFVGPDIPIDVSQGLVTVNVAGTSRGDLRIFRLSGMSRLQNIQFWKWRGVGPAEINLLDSQLDIVFFTQEKRIEITQLDLTTEESSVEVTGMWDWHADRPYYDLEISALPFNLTELANVMRPWIEAKKYDLAMSGMSRLHVAARHTADVKDINVDLDLSDAAVKWKEYFDKIDVFPLTITGRWSNQNEKRKSKGDLNIRSKGMSLKGTLSDWDPTEKFGQISIISNKIDGEELSAFLPWCRAHEVTGKVKGLLNVKGKVLEPKTWIGEEPYSLNVSFTDFGLKWDGVHYQDISGYVEVQDGDWEIRGFKWRAEDSEWKVNFVKRFINEKHDIRYDIEANEFDFQHFLDRPQTPIFSKPMTHFFHLLGPIDQGGGNIRVDRLTLGKTMNPKVKWATQWIGNTVTFEPIALRAYGGTVEANIALRADWQIPTLDVELKGKSLQLESLFNPQYTGELTYTAQLTGDAQSIRAFRASAEGEASVKMTKGQFKPLDVYAGFGQVAQFSKFIAHSTEALAFDQLNVHLQFDRDAIYFNQLNLMSDAYFLRGEGSMTWDGGVTAQVHFFPDVYLSREIFGEHYQTGETLSMPLQITGSFDKPEYIVPVDQLQGQTFKRIFPQN